MKGEIYNFVLFSSIGDGTVANKSFFVDWSILPESRYKLTFHLHRQRLLILQLTKRCYFLMKSDAVIISYVWALMDQRRIMRVS